MVGELEFFLPRVLFSSIPMCVVGVDNVQKNLNHLFHYMGNDAGPRWIFLSVFGSFSSGRWIRL